MSKITEVIINALAPALQSIAEEKLCGILRKIKPDATRADVLKSLYVPIDTALEKYTDETKTKIDDAIVQAFKSSIETVAAEDGITLPNVDND